MYAFMPNSGTCGLQLFLCCDLAGRPWRVDELRIKSNSDLHKLWYVLLKERNMLLTMQHEYERQCELFPNPERIEKVGGGVCEQVNVAHDPCYFVSELGGVNFSILIFCFMWISFQFSKFVYYSLALSGISVLSFDSTLPSPLLFFCLVLLLFLSYIFLPAGPFF